MTTTDETTQLEAWEAALRRLQDDLDGVDRALVAGSELTARPWVPPADLGPLPGALRARAEDLLARIERAGTQLRQAQDELAGQRADVGRRRAAGAAYHGTAPIEERDPTA